MHFLPELKNKISKIEGGVQVKLQREIQHTYETTFRKETKKLMILLFEEKTTYTEIFSHLENVVKINNNQKR